MRYYLLSLILFIGFITGCEKEPIDSVIETEKVNYSSDSLYNSQDEISTAKWVEEFREGSRFGTTAPLFFIESASIDNQNMPNQVRTQIAFNHKKVESFRLTRIGTSTASVQYSVNGVNGGVSQPILIVAKYALEVKYIGSEKYEYVSDVITKVLGQVYVYTPTKGLLFTANQNKWVKIVRLSTTRSHYHLFHGITKLENQYDITTDDGVLRKEFLESTITTSVFILNHVM